MDDLVDILAAGPVSYTFMEYSKAFCHLPEVASDVLLGTFVSLIVSDNDIKFGKAGLNRSRENRLQVVSDVVFDGFFFPENLRPEVASDIISGGVIGAVVLDVHVNVVIIGQNHSRVIRPAHFVINDDDNRRSSWP